jgi:hypothetical protein
MFGPKRRRQFEHLDVLLQVRAVLFDALFSVTACLELAWFEESDIRRDARSKQSVLFVGSKMAIRCSGINTPTPGGHLAHT